MNNWGGRECRATGRRMKVLSAKTSFREVAKPCNNLGGRGCRAIERRLEVCVCLSAKHKLSGGGKAVQQLGRQRVSGDWEEAESV